MVSERIDIDQKELETISLTFLKQMDENELFIHDKGVDRYELNIREKEAVHATALFKTIVTFNTEFYSEILPGKTTSPKLPRLTEKEAIEQQFIEAANLRAKWENAKSIELVVCEGKNDVVLEDNQIGYRTFDCSSCGGNGLVVCTCCSGAGHKECTKCDTIGQISCSSCHGQGRENKSRDKLTPCGHCTGTGRCDCEECGGTKKLNCQPCSGAGHIPCADCSATGGMIEIYKVKYKCSFKHNLVSSNFHEDELHALENWMRNGFQGANGRPLHTPKVTIRLIEADVNPTTEESQHALSIMIDTMKITIEGTLREKPLNARMLQFDRPWVWFNSYLDDDILSIAKSANVSGSLSANEFFQKIVKHPKINKSLQDEINNELHNGSKWTTLLHIESRGAISKEAADDLYQVYLKTRCSGKVAIRIFSTALIMILASVVFYVL